MPSWMPEGNQVLPSSDEMRTLAVWLQLLVNSQGNKPSMYPEGCIPLPSDDELRLEHKIARVLQ